MVRNNTGDFANRVELVKNMRFANRFSKTVIIEKKNGVQEAKRYWIEIIIWVNRSKSNQKNVEATVYLKNRVSNS